MTKQKSAIVLVLALLFSMFFGGSSYAEGQPKYSVSLSPLQTDMELDPGTSEDGEISVKNTGTEPIVFEPFARPYQVQNYTYDSDITVKNQYTEVVDWITFYESEYTIEPGETATVRYVVSVPDNAHGGSQYAALGISTDSGEGDGMIKAGHEIAVILRADISGTIIQSGSINEQIIPGFLLTPPMGGKITATNSGNITINATSTMRITNSLTGVEIFNNSETPTTVSLLPETIRTYDVEWPDSPRLGLYAVTITTSLLGEIATESRTVFICPIWLICAIILLVLAAIAVIIVKKRHQSHIQSRGFKFKN